MSTETKNQRIERQIKEAFIDGYTSALDHGGSGPTPEAEAERAWREENTTSWPGEERE